MRFVKMEGCGNDYVFVDAGLSPQGNPAGEVENPEALSRAVSERHRGIGGDGLILLSPGTESPVRMRMYNADGTEGMLCLNGLRCAAKYTAESVEGTGDAFVVETSAGPREVRVERGENGLVHTVEVEAGHPDFRREAIPAAGMGNDLWDERFYVGGMYLPGYGVNVGNPHLVLWMGEPDAVLRAPLEEIGDHFMHDKRFPEGVNVHLVCLRHGRGLLMRSWERGSGITLACGSGAVAAYAVARRLKRVEDEAIVEMPGGEVRVRANPDGSLVMRGPAREVYRGEWEPGGHVG